jgi:hypothetical protein
MDRTTAEQLTEAALQVVARRPFIPDQPKSDEPADLTAWIKGMFGTKKLSGTWKLEPKRKSVLATMQVRQGLTVEVWKSEVTQQGEVNMLWSWPTMKLKHEEVSKPVILGPTSVKILMELA